MTGPRRSRIEVEFGRPALPKIRRFLGSFAARNGWGDDMAARLDAVGEEALLTLLPEDEEGKEPERGRRLHLAAYRGEGGAVLEFVVAPRGEEPPGPDCDSRRAGRRGGLGVRARDLPPAAPASLFLRSPPAVP